MAEKKRAIRQTAKGEHITQVAGNLVVPEDIQSAFDEAAELINRGKAQAAQVLLERIWRYHNDTMRPQQKSNCWRLLGCALERQEKREEGGRCFLKAKDLDPLWEKARAFEAFGYLCLGNLGKAHALAENVLQEFSQNTIAWSVWIQTVPDTLSLPDIQGKVPTHLQKDAEVAMALAVAAATRGDYDTAEQFVAETQKQLPENPRVIEMLADLMFQRAGINEGLLRQRRPSDKERVILQQSQELYTRVLIKWQEEGSVSSIVRVKLRRAWAYAALAENKKAIADAEAAYEMAPDDPQVTYSYAAFIGDQNLDAAIDALRRVIGKDDKPGVEHLLGQMLRQRNRGDDREEAVRLVKGRLQHLGNIPESSRADYMEVVLQLEREISGLECAINTLKSLPAEVMSDRPRMILESETLWRGGKKEDALKMAKDLYSAIDEYAALDDKRRLANLLQMMGLHREALHLWKGIVRTDCVGVDTHRMIECAKRCGAENEILELGAQLRQNRVWDKNIFEYEIYLRQKYNDWKECRSILEDYVEDPLDEQYLPFARAHLSHVLGVLHRPDLIETDLSRLPSPGDVHPGMGRMIVQSLRLAGEPLKAVDFAYELIRENFSSLDAHLTMMSFMVPLGPKQLELEPPGAAGPGTAVQYKEDGTDAPVWHIIEDSEYELPDASRNEYLLGHTYSQKMVGLKKGDTFLLRGGEIQERKAAIVEILSKYHFRIIDCLHRMEDRFPDSKVVITINAYREDGQIDLDPIKRLADLGEEQGKELLGLYKGQRLPIYSLAIMMGRDLCLTLEHLRNSPDIGVHCRLGHPSEVETAARDLKEADELVLDEMTLATLLLCDAWEQLSRIPKRLVVSAGTLLSIENWEVMHADPNNPGMTAGNVDGRLVFLERSKEKIELMQGKVRALIEFVRDHCAVESGVPLSLFETSQRDLFAKTLGEAFAETMAISRNGRRVLWTDDLISAAVFTQGPGGRRVWTQLVFEYLAQQKLADTATASELTLKLISSHYWFTSLNTEAAVTAMARANWDVDSSPLKEVLAYFGDRRVTLDANLMLIIGRLLKRCWEEDRLGLKASAVTVRVLNELARRPEAPIPILAKALLIWVRRAFGLDVLTAEQVGRVFQDWLAARGGGAIML